MPSKTTPRRQQAFLEAYARCGVLSEAAKVSNCERSSHYEWLTDPQYKAAFEQAQQIANDSLENELFRRVRDGVEETVTEASGDTRITRRFSDTLLIFALKGAKPDKYREQWRGELAHSGTLVVSRGPDLSQLTHEQLEQLERLALSAATDAVAHAGSGSDPGGEDEESPEQDQQLLP
jgi:hypothetical protein